MPGASGGEGDWLSGTRGDSGGVEMFHVLIVVTVGNRDQLWTLNKQHN